jgi:hypothetical protein
MFYRCADMQISDVQIILSEPGFTGLRDGQEFLIASKSC